MSRAPTADRPGRRPFVAAIVTERHVFARFFARPSRPTGLDALLASHDIVLYDRAADSDEVRNLAATPSLARQHAALVMDLSRRLDALLDDEAPRGAAPLPWAPAQEAAKLYRPPAMAARPRPSRGSRHGGDGRCA